MTAHFNLDEESFQGFLSDAFVVQQSGLETEFLACAVDLQRAIATGELDLDGAMDAIAERALHVAHASGTAIALLQGDQLIYRAGRGSGAANVGRHMMAVLCGSAPTAGRAILRVENARSDARIEAAVCRQFGAESLLILPVFYADTLAGVLNVMFDAAHVFQPREVRSYRLMATLLGEAMSYPAEREPANSLAEDRSIPPRLERITPPFEACPAGVSLTAGAPAIETTDQAREDSVAEDAKLPAIMLSATKPERPQPMPLHKRRWDTAAAVAAVLVIACWIGFSDLRPTPTLVPSAQASSELEPQSPVQPVSANSDSNFKPQAAPVRETRMKMKKSAKTRPAPVMDGTTRVRYFSDDVTVRYFSSSKAPQRAMDTNGQVRHFSNDVTVRHFNPQSPVSPSSHPDGSSAQRVTR